MLGECLSSDYQILHIFAVKEWVSRQKNTVALQDIITEVTHLELGRISNLKTPQEVVAVVQMPVRDKVPTFTKAIALDNIQDPGNLGSIIRIADWYGIRHVICNTQTADIYNSKVLQATMGSIFRVQCHYTDLKLFLSQEGQIPVYACVLNGKNINEVPRPDAGIILIGNESKGLSAELIALSRYQVGIPRIGEAESLNAAVATGIICHILLS
jgi:TrmH family RNA methyltransferase